MSASTSCAGVTRARSSGRSAPPRSTYVKRLLVESGMRRPSEEEIATGLARLLHELSDEDLFRDRRARREAVRQAVIAEQRRARTARRRSRPAGAGAAAVRMRWSGIEIPTLELER